MSLRGKNKRFFTKFRWKEKYIIFIGLILSVCALISFLFWNINYIASICISLCIIFVSLVSLYFFCCAKLYIKVSNNKIIVSGWSVFLKIYNGEIELGDIGSILQIKFEIKPRKYTNDVIFDKTKFNNDKEIDEFLREFSELKLIIIDNNAEHTFLMNEYSMEKIESFLSFVIKQMEIVNNVNYFNTNIKELISDLNNDINNPLISGD